MGSLKLTEARKNEYYIMLCFHCGLSEMAGRSFYIIRNSLIFCIIVSKEGDDIVLYLKREDSTLEEDFFVRTKNSLLPLEVKARRGTSKSLATLIAREKYPDIRYGLKASAGNIGFSDNILTFPYFCVFLLKRFLDVCGL